MAQKSETRGGRDAEKAAAADSARVAQTVRWDDSKMTSTYANVCNVSSTREELTLLFGTNQSWYMGQQELTIQLTNRIILNPFAAKRLSVLLGNIMREYEARFGMLPIETVAPPPSEQQA
jgi:hypothetical protein